MTYEEQQMLQVILGLTVVTFVLYILRQTPLGFLWQIYKWFWIILFATLLLNFAKKEIKEWWGK
jgi:hypothetical protein